MTLRTGGGPACLLLELWARQAEGQRWTCFNPLHSTVLELLDGGYIAPFKPHWAMYTLTPAGRAAAQVLEASTGHADA